MPIVKSAETKCFDAALRIGEKTLETPAERDKVNMEHSL